MKGLIWNCQSVAWKYPGQKTKTVRSCLLVYLCCEKNDQTKQVKESVRRIIQLNKKRYHREKTIIFPFAHLSEEIAEPIIAQKLLGRLGRLLSEKILVEKLKFNHKKELNIHLLPKNNDVSYFSYQGGKKCTTN